jgi:inositol-phosphate phosphatase / L-galactose 1-phosphate phosphatase
VIARVAAEAAGKKIKSAFLEAKVITSKSSTADIVTETDKKCEDLVFEMIRKQFPTHKYIGEESHAGEGYAYLHRLTSFFLFSLVDISSVVLMQI